MGAHAAIVDWIPWQPVPVHQRLRPYPIETRRLLDKLLARGSLRVISGQTVVAGALDAVAQAALRNSLDTGE